MPEASQEQLITNENSEIFSKDVRKANTLYRTLAISIVSLRLLAACTGSQVPNHVGTDESLDSPEVEMDAVELESVEEEKVTPEIEYYELEVAKRERYSSVIGTEELWVLPSGQIEIVSTSTQESSDVVESSEAIEEENLEPNVIVQKEWTDEVKQVEIVGGEANFEAYLFVDKASDDNHDRLYTKAGDSALTWNATEAAYRFWRAHSSKPTIL